MERVTVGTLFGHTKEKKRETLLTWCLTAHLRYSCTISLAGLILQLCVAAATTIICFHQVRFFFVCCFFLFFFGWGGGGGGVEGFEI